MTHQYCDAVHHQHASLVGSLSNIEGNTVDSGYLCALEEDLWKFKPAKMAQHITVDQKDIKKDRAAILQDLLQIKILSQRKKMRLIKSELS